jgi:toxin ParE1/3/4
MKEFRIRLSDAAISDILEQSEWYDRQEDGRLSRRWESAVSSAVLRIAKNPRLGAPCEFKAEELHRLRRIPVAGFPKHLIFYQFHADELLILRIIHGARDLESLL